MARKIQGRPSRSQREGGRPTKGGGGRTSFPNHTIISSKNNFGNQFTSYGIECDFDVSGGYSVGCDSPTTLTQWAHYGAAQCAQEISQCEAAGGQWQVVH